MPVAPSTRAAVETAARDAGGAWLAFLMMAFAIVGLTGLFATFAAPLTLERALAREAVLDQALAAWHGAEPPAAALERLRPMLDDSAAAILPAGEDFDRRVAAERVAVRERLRLEQAATTLRLRWLICVITAMAAAFGAACFHAGRRSS